MREVTLLASILCLVSVHTFTEDTVDEEQACHESADAQDCEEDDEFSFLQLETPAMSANIVKAAKATAPASTAGDEQDESSMLQTLVKPLIAPQQEKEKDESSMLQTLVKPSLVAASSPRKSARSKSGAGQISQNQEVAHANENHDKGPATITQITRESGKRTAASANTLDANPILLQVNEETNSESATQATQPGPVIEPAKAEKEISASGSAMPEASPSSAKGEYLDSWIRFFKLCSVVVQLALVVSWAIGRRLRSHLRAPGVVRENVQKLPVLPWSKMEKLLAPYGEERIPRCMKFQYLFRMEARIEGPSDPTQMALCSPLGQKDCVVWTVMVSAPKVDGAMAEPIAFKSKAMDFFVSPLDSPQTRVKVCGGDVSLFDICLGFTSGSTTYEDAPSHWQTFVDSYKVAPASPGDKVLKFEECALLVGTVITLVGEPSLCHDGNISLVPRQVEYHDDIFTGTPVALPSKNRTAAGPQMEATAILEVLAAKVLASDDVQLLHYWAPMRRRFRSFLKNLFRRLHPGDDEKMSVIMDPPLPSAKAEGVQLDIVTPGAAQFCTLPVSRSASTSISTNNDSGDESPAPGLALSKEVPPFDCPVPTKKDVSGSAQFLGPAPVPAG
jgi:hypothetical protein